MILDAGMKVMIAHRRLFERDQPRVFVGRVDGYENGLARVTGYTWTRDGYHGGFHRKSDLRTKIVAIASGTVIVYQLDSTVDLERLTIEPQGNDVIATDGCGFRMDLTEHHLHPEPQPALGKLRG